MIVGGPGTPPPSTPQKRPLAPDGNGGGGGGAGGVEAQAPGRFTGEGFWVDRLTGAEGDRLLSARELLEPIPELLDLLVVSSECRPNVLVSGRQDYPRPLSNRLPTPPHTQVASSWTGSRARQASRPCRPASISRPPSSTTTGQRTSATIPAWSRRGWTKRRRT